jgi:hypothetical protein
LLTYAGGHVARSSSLSVQTDIMFNDRVYKQGEQIAIARSRSKLRGKRLQH